MKNSRAQSSPGREPARRPSTVARAGSRPSPPPDPGLERDLLEAALAGDARAFDRFFEGAYTRLAAWAEHRGDDTPTRRRWMEACLERALGDLDGGKLPENVPVWLYLHARQALSGAGARPTGPPEAPAASPRSCAGDTPP